MIADGCRCRVPKPRVNLTRFHGVFEPDSQYRSEVTPARRGKGNPCQSKEDKIPEQCRQAMIWAQRLKRMFNIGVSICPKCGGEARVIVCVEEQAVIDRILDHLMNKGALSSTRVCQGTPLTRISLHQHPGIRSCSEIQLAPLQSEGAA